MRTLYVILAIGLAYLAHHGWSGLTRQEFPDYAATMGSPSGFIPVAMPSGTPEDTVLILTPRNCPSRAARRADALADALTSRGIPNVRRNSFRLDAVSDEAATERTLAVFRGDIPAVYINGMGKPNPTVAEIAAEYERR